MNEVNSAYVYHCIIVGDPGWIKAVDKQAEDLAEEASDTFDAIAEWKPLFYSVVFWIFS